MSWPPQLTSLTEAREVVQDVQPSTQKHSHQMSKEIFKSRLSITALSSTSRPHVILSPIKASKGVTSLPDNSHFYSRLSTATVSTTRVSTVSGNTVTDSFSPTSVSTLSFSTASVSAVSVSTVSLSPASVCAVS